MNKTKKLISNTFIFALGTLGSKLLQYLLLPYYTALLSTYEYGIIDNLQNIASLLIPIVSLTIYEAIFRYAMDKDYDSKIVFSIGTIISLSGVIIFFVLTLIFNIILPSTYIWITFIYVIFNIFRTNCSQYVRAIGYTKLFTIDNLFQTLIILLANIMFLSYFNLGITGYMLAYCVGNFISTVFLILSAKLYRDFIFCFPKQISIKMLKFSVPLIPNTICWWISSCSDRFMITSMIGAAVNGLYAIANKIPTVMTIFINIFLQAWQISANDEVNNANISIYYSTMYKYISILLSIMGIIIILSSKFIIRLMASSDFFLAWQYVPILSLAIVFFAKAQFLGTVYTTFKNTKMAFFTNLLAAVINIIGNFVLIPVLGGIGAGISTAFSYFILWIVRTFNIKCFINFNLEIKSEVIVTILLVLATIIMYFELGIIGSLIQIIILLYIIYIFRNNILEIINRLVIKR